MLVTIVSFVIILSVLVLIHEWGHFITALKSGVDVEEFGIGFPPRIFSVKRKGVIYSINLIPLGGFVKIRGESGEDDDPRSFSNQPTWKKAIILSSGVMMNFVLAFVLLSIAFYFGLPQTIDSSVSDDKLIERNVIIADLAPQSPAEEQGIQIGDKIVEINGYIIKDSQDVLDKIEKYREEEIKIVIVRNKEKKEFSIKPKVLEEGEPAVIGIGLVDTGIVDYGIFSSIWQGFKVTVLTIGLILKALYNLIIDLIRQGKLAAELAGPVGVAVITGQFVRLGWIYTLQFMAILSINLGIINILPFPALDGGRLMFLGVEKISGRKLNKKVENWIHNSGFVLLMIVIIFITFRDISRYGTHILESLKSIF